MAGGLSLDHAAAGLKQLIALVGEADRRRRAGSDMGLDRIGEIVDIDQCLLDPRILDPVERAIDQRLACHPHQGFGGRGRQRPHPLTEPGGHQHCGIRNKSGHLISPPPFSRRSAGMFAANHAASGAATGCARSRSMARHTRGIIAR